MNTRNGYYDLSGHTKQILDHVALVRQRVDDVFVEQLKLGDQQVQALEQLAVVVNKSDELLKKQMDSQVLSQAISEIQRLREEGKNAFGHYSLTRHRTLGIIQAPDDGIIDLEVAAREANKSAIEAHGYWLPTALLSLIHWRQERQEPSRKSVQSSMQRNDTKASLFYALAHRRESTRKNPRTNSIRFWLRRYFSTQSFDALNRETILVINALASNVFGKEIKNECAELFLAKIEEYLFKDEENYVRQVEAWFGELLKSNRVQLAADDYPSLKSHCLNWHEVEKSLVCNRHYRQLFLDFEILFGSQLEYHPNILVELDKLMSSLINDFEEKELEHLKEIDKYQLIIDNLGDKAEATKAAEQRKGLFDEKLDCGRLLVNSFFYPEHFKASKGAQRIAAALSKEHLAKGLEELHNKYAAEEVKEVLLKIDEWTGASLDGTNEAQLVTSLEKHIEEKRKAAVAKLELPIKNILIGAGIILGSWFLGGGISWLLLIGGLIGGFFLFNSWRQHTAQTGAINAQYAHKMENETNLLRKLLAEVVDLREELTDCRASYVQLKVLVDGINFDGMISRTSAEVKDDYAEAIEEGLMTKLPEWDLLPMESVMLKKKTGSLI